jgi:hypothetical protein
VTIANAGAGQVISSVDGNIGITGTASGSALDTVYSGFGESSLTTTGGGTVSLRALGSGDANGLSIGTTGTALDYYGSALNQWQLSTASNLVFTGSASPRPRAATAAGRSARRRASSSPAAAGVDVTSGKLDLVIAPQAGAVVLGTGSLPQQRRQHRPGRAAAIPAASSTARCPATGATGNSVYVNGIDSAATIDAGGGNVWMMGTGAAATSAGNVGIALQSGGSVQTAGAGAITLVGNGGGSGASNSNVGVQLTGTTLRSTGSGDIAVTGNGGSAASGGSNMGVRLNTGSLIESTGAGDIVVVGNGGNTTSGSNNRGVLLNTGNTIQTTGSGAISITGHSGDGGLGTGAVDNHGADIQGVVAGNGGAGDDRRDRRQRHGHLQLGHAPARHGEQHRLGFDHDLRHRGRQPGERRHVELRHRPQQRHGDRGSTAT